MATPDAIDRGQGKPSSAAPPIIVYYFVDPVTGARRGVQTADPIQQAILIGQGYKPIAIPSANWGQFVRDMGPGLTGAGQTQPDLGGVPPLGTSGLTPAEQAALDAATGQTNADAAAAQQNLDRAFGISQAGRDRAALQAKENYGAAVQPTLTAGAFSGAGYHQALGDLFMKAIERDRTLAGLADDQTSAQFQLDVSRQNTERQRQNQLQTLFNSASTAVQNRYGRSVEDLLAWTR